MDGVANRIADQFDTDLFVAEQEAHREIGHRRFLQRLGIKTPLPSILRCRTAAQLLKLRGIPETQWGITAPSPAEPDLDELAETLRLLHQLSRRLNG